MHLVLAGSVRILELGTRRGISSLIAETGSSRRIWTPPRGTERPAKSLLTPS